MSIRAICKCIYLDNNLETDILHDLFRLENRIENRIENRSNREWGLQIIISQYGR